MTRARRHRWLTVFLSVGMLLFAQLSLAAYVCPAAAQASGIARMAEAGLPCAETMALAMDEEQPALCHAHCQASEQSAETFKLPVPAIGSRRVAVLTFPLPAAPAASWVRAPLRANASPPLAIAHCCWRI